MNVREECTTPTAAQIIEAEMEMMSNKSVEVIDRSQSLNFENN